MQQSDADPDVAQLPESVDMLMHSAAAGTPKRGDSKNEPVYLVHGYTYGDCGSRWNTLKGKLRDWRWTGPIHTVGYYYANEKSRDTNCDINLADAKNPLTYNDSIMEVGRRVAWDIHNRYAKDGRSVDVVAHSMGGLVMRAALTGVATKAKGFPPHLYIEDVVTLGTPHQGFDCRSTEWLQCREMRPGSALLGSLRHNPQSAQRTDWTLVSSEDDETVSANSGIDLNQPAGHKIKYLATNKVKVTHSSIRTEHRYHREWNLRYWNHYFKDDKGKETSKGWSPLHTAGFAIYYADKW
ncbi:esterase/lipase family protein [Allokutzneria albata]|nr:hypothetical protein [Allokutzneria albata]